MSPRVKELITRILAVSPEDRPSFQEIVEDEFFTQGLVPGYIPTTATITPPNFEPMSRVVSQANYVRLIRNAGLIFDQPIAPIAAPKIISRSNSLSNVKSASSSLAQQEKEFHKAIQPGSPISALLSSARQPLLVAGGVRESPLRKLAAAKASKRDLRKITEEQTANNVMESIIGGKPAKIRPLELERDTLDNHKARIVQQMAPVDATPSLAALQDRENIAPLRKEPKGKERAMPVIQENPTASAPVVKDDSLTVFEAVAATLTLAFDARSLGKVFKNACQLPSDDEIFIVSWVDYCNKYGMGYALTDGSVGVHFNDSTTLVLSPDKMCVTVVTTGKLY